MKLLNGKELAGFIKERHSRQVRTLRANKIYLKLAIVQVKDDPVINTYVKLKQKYGSDIGIDVEVHKVEQNKITELLNTLSNNDSVTGIIIQLPLTDPSATEEIVNLVPANKDVDSLARKSLFEPATPMAILWLLAGYNIDVASKKVVIVGKGKLVGGPLEIILRNSNVDVDVVEGPDPNIRDKTLKADILITAASQPEIISSDMIPANCVVIDAGVASEDGKTLGNLKKEVFERDDLTITPEKGGVGPLTVCALFENVIRAAQNAR